MKTLLSIFLTFAALSDCSQVEQISKKVSELRNLPIKQPVACTVSSQEQLKAYIQKKIKEHYPVERLKYEAIVYEKLGFIASRNEYEKVITQLYTEEMAGVYDPELKQFMMAGWIADHLQQPVITHELVHALVDQQYDLRKYMDPNISTDQQFARSAIAEGDATFIMLRDQLPTLDDALNFSLSEQSKPGTNRGLLFQIYFPYMGGLGYIQQCLRQKCDLNKFYTTPPTSTKEILFNEKYSEISQDEIKKFLSAEISYKDVFGLVGFKSFLIANEIGISDDDLKKLSADLLTVSGDKMAWLLKLTSPFSDDLVKIIGEKYTVKKDGNYLLIS